MDKELLALIGIILTIIGYTAYIRSILTGTTMPHPFSWIIWATLTAIAFFAQLSENAGPGAWITGTTAAVSFGIVALAYYKSRDFDITRADWVTFLAGLSAIPLWLVTENPLWAVILITVIDALGFFPTFRKCWDRPGNELPLHYIIAGLKFVLSLAALDTFNLTTTLYPASLVLMNWIFIAMLYWRRYRLHATKHYVKSG